MSKFNGIKTNNAPARAKRELRDRILTAINVDKKNVLEVFCGAGEMYRDVWHKADNYLGIDKVKYFDERNTICGDADKAIRTVNLNDYNIFDIDAYGSPYNILEYIVLNRNKDGDIAFVVTDGSAMDLRLGRVSKGLRALSGIENHILKRASNMHDILIKDVVENIEMMTGKKASNFMLAKGKTGSGMRYYGFVLSDVA